MHLSKILIPLIFQSAASVRPALRYRWRSAFAPRLRFYTFSLHPNIVWKRLLSAKRASRSNFVTFFVRHSRTWA